MSALPTGLTTNMRAQAAEALEWLNQRPYQPISVNLADHTIADLRDYVLMYYTRNNTYPKDSKLDHNVRATALAEWFPGTKVVS